jgi:hypothetical protein
MVDGVLVVSGAPKWAQRRIDVDVGWIAAR